MFTRRNLNNKEQAFIASQIHSTKKLIFGLFVVVVIIIAITAIAIYSEKGSNVFRINIFFGILIVLLYFLNWILKGYKQHQINPEIHKETGTYKRVYESYGKRGAYYDTINGYKVKTPWHWRKYLKTKKQSITYEYILRDGAIAVNEGTARYMVSVNDTLSLDYEIENGLTKTKRISLLNFASLFLVLPVILILFMDRNVEYGLQFSELFKTEKNAITINSPEYLNTIIASNYIKIKKAWVFQFKKMSDYRGENYLISNAERDRIYNHPFSNTNTTYFLPSRAFTSPDEEKFKTDFKKQLKDNPLFNKYLYSIENDSILENTINKEYKRRFNEHQIRVTKAKKTESILAELQPKNFFFKLNDETFNTSKETTYSIKNSLEHQVEVSGFYNAKTKTLVSFEDQNYKRKRIKNAFILLCFCLIVTGASVIAIVKIIYNSYIKIQLVKAQLQTYNGPTRLER